MVLDAKQNWRSLANLLKSRYFIWVCGCGDYVGKTMMPGPDSAAKCLLLPRLPNWGQLLGDAAGIGFPAGYWLGRAT